MIQRKRERGGSYHPVFCYVFLCGFMADGYALLLLFFLFLVLLTGILKPVIIKFVMFVFCLQHIIGKQFDDDENDVLMKRSLVLFSFPPFSSSYNSLTSSLTGILKPVIIIFLLHFAFLFACHYGEAVF